MPVWLGIALFGALGSLARWQFGSWVLVKSGQQAFPWGTVAVNLLGCFLFGLVFALAEQGVISKDWRLVILTGFMGAFTTFSTFAFDTLQMARAGGPPGPSILHLFLQVGLGLVCVALGMWLGGGAKPTT